MMTQVKTTMEEVRANASQPAAPPAAAVPPMMNPYAQAAYNQAFLSAALFPGGLGNQDFPYG